MSLGKSLLLSGPLTLPATEGMPGFGHRIPEDSGFFCLRHPLQDLGPLPESTLRRGYGGCVWIPRLSPSLSLGSALACRMSSSCALPLRETPASMPPPAWGAHSHAALLPLLGSRDKGIIFGTGAVTQQMNYLSLGMEERRHFAGLLNSVLDWRVAAWVRGHVCMGLLLYTRL